LHGKKEWEYDSISRILKFTEYPLDSALIKTEDFHFYVILTDAYNKKGVIHHDEYTERILTFSSGFKMFLKIERHV